MHFCTILVYKNKENQGRWLLDYFSWCKKKSWEKYPTKHQENKHSWNDAGLAVASNLSRQEEAGMPLTAPQLGPPEAADGVAEL